MRSDNDFQFPEQDTKDDHHSRFSASLWYFLVLFFCSFCCNTYRCIYFSVLRKKNKKKHCLHFERINAGRASSPPHDPELERQLENKKRIDELFHCCFCTIFNKLRVYRICRWLHSALIHILHRAPTFVVSRTNNTPEIDSNYLLKVRKLQISPQNISGQCFSFFVNY